MNRDDCLTVLVFVAILVSIFVCAKASDIPKVEPSIQECHK